MRNKGIIFLLLFVVLFIGSWLRLAGIITNSFAFTYDVGRDLLEVHKIAINHHFTLIGQTTGLAGVFYGPWWYYILSIPFIISRGNPQGLALFIALTGICTIILGYFLGKKIDGIFLGVTFFSLISFSPYMVGLSSQIWNPNIAPILVMVLLFFIFNIFGSKSIREKTSLLVIGLILGLLLDIEIVFGALFLIGVIIALIFILKRKIFNWKFLLFLPGIFLILLPRMIFELRHNFLMIKSIIVNPSSTSFLTFSLPSFQTIVDRLQFMNNLFTNTLAGGNRILSLIILSVTTVICIFYYHKANNLEKRFINMIIIIFSVFFVGLSIFSHFIFEHYVVGLPLLYILFLSLSLNLIRKNHLGKILSVVVLVFLLWINLNPIEQLSNLKNPLWEGNAAVYRNQIAVIDYIYSNASGKRFNYVTYTPPIYDYTYQYLFSWYGKNKYGYVPDHEKKKLFFLIIESDNQYPFRLTDWFNVRKDDGKILKEEIVKGGIRVQTREH